MVEWMIMLVQYVVCSADVYEVVRLTRRVWNTPTT